MNVGIIGCGSIGSRHARNASDMGHAITVFDLRSPTEALVTPVGRGVCLCSSLPIFLEHRPDAVLICTPASTHAAVAQELLAAGYRGPLFCEKPLATSVAECDVFRSWPHATTMVGYNWRFHYQLQPLISEYRGAFDAAFHFSCETFMGTWPGQNYSDPVLECSHEIDTALRLGAVFAAAGSRGNAGIWLQFQEPSIVVDLQWARPASRRLTISMGFSEAFHLLRQTHQLDLGAVLDQSYIDELAHFLDCAASGVPTTTPFADGIRVLEVIERAKEWAACQRS